MSQTPLNSVPGMGAAMPAQSTRSSAPSGVAEDKTRVITGPFILSYPHLFTARAPTNARYDAEGKPLPVIMQYDCELLIYKSSPTCNKVLSDLSAAMTAAIQATTRFPANPKWPGITDAGSRERYSGPPAWRVNAKSTSRPTLRRHPDLSPIMDPDELYPGCIVHAFLRANAFVKTTGSGISWFLNGIIKLADGPRLATGSAGAVLDDVYGGLDIAQIDPALALVGTENWTPPAVTGHAAFNPAAQFLPQAAPHQVPFGTEQLPPGFPQ